MSLLFLWVGVPLLAVGLLVGGFSRSLRSRTAAGRAVAVAAPLAAAAGVAYAVEFPSLVRQIHSSTAADDPDESVRSMARANPGGR